MPEGKLEGFLLERVKNGHGTFHDSAAGFKENQKLLSA